MPCDCIVHGIAREGWLKSGHSLQRQCRCKTADCSGSIMISGVMTAEWSVYSKLFILYLFLIAVKFDTPHNSWLALGEILADLRVSVVKYAWSRHPKSAAGTCTRWSTFQRQQRAITVCRTSDCMHIAAPGSTAYLAT